MNYTLNLPKTANQINQDWISRLKESENKTLKGIYIQYRSYCLKQIIVKYQLQEEEAKEIFQLSVIVFYDNVMKGKLTSLNVNLRSYLMGIAHNKIYELYRTQQKVKKSKSAFSSMFNTIISLENKSDAVSDSRLNLIINAIRHIGDPCRSILEMFYYQNQSLREITEHYKYKNENTTKNLKYKCIQRIKKHIQL